MYAPFPAKISLCSGLECSQALGLTADDSLRAAVGGWGAARVVWCFKLKINVAYIVLEINIHAQNEGALTTPQPYPHVLIYISTLSEHCPFGWQSFTKRWSWHRQECCSRKRLGFCKGADKKSDCLRQGYEWWVEAQLPEPFLQCLLQGEKQGVWAQYDDEALFITCRYHTIQCCV